MNLIPELGMGATIGVGSDSYPATIIYISKNKHTIFLQEDHSKRIDKNGMSESQEYEYIRDATAPIQKATLRKNGKYAVVGSKQSIGIGFRRRYYDFSF